MMIGIDLLGNDVTWHASLFDLMYWPCSAGDTSQTGHTNINRI